MFLASLLNSTRANSRRYLRRPSVHCFYPRLEALEQRYVLTINEFPTPTPFSRPNFITAGPDGNVWFTEFLTNQIGRITPEGLITEYSIPNGNARPTGITAGPDGNLWFSEYLGGKIGRITPDGTQVTEFPTPASNSFPTQIITGPDGNLWFVESNVNRIARLDPSTNAVTEFPASTDASTSLTVGPDGNLWFTEPGMIGRLAPDGSQLLNVPIPTANAQPEGITAGPDGNLWFTEFHANQVARINPTDLSIREFRIPTADSQPRRITTGLDGNLWFTEGQANQIGQITVDGQVQEFMIPTGTSGPFSIVTGPDGNIWFTEVQAHKIGRYNLSLPTAHLLVAAPSRSTAGTPFNVTVTALDAANRIVTDYTGTLHFSSSDTYPGVLPPDYTFTSGDQGVHTFSGVTLYTSGVQTLTAQDTVSGAIAGSATIAVQSSSATHLALTAPSTAVAGMSFDVTVTALDRYGNVDTGYSDTVTLFSSDRTPQLLDYTFTPADNGSHDFALSLFTAAVQTLLVRDAVNGSIASSAVVAVSAAAADHFLVTAPALAVSGMPFPLSLAALDPYGNLDGNYHGSIHVSTSDTAAGTMLPADYTLTVGEGGDDGVHTFSGGVTLITPGNQTLTVTDTANSTITGRATVTVTSPAAPPGGGAGGPWTPTRNAGVTPVPAMQSAQQVALLERLSNSLNEEPFALTLPVRPWRHDVDVWFQAVLDRFLPTVWDAWNASRSSCAGPQGFN